MEKILNIVHRSHIVMSGFNTPNADSYRVFLRKFRKRTLDFGSMSDDRNNYSRDFHNVLGDYKSSSKEYLQRR